MQEETSIAYELLKERNIFLNSEINKASARSIITLLLYLNGQDNKEPIHIYVSGGGGSVYDGLGIIDVIKSIKAPVYTYCIGLAASMSAMIFLSGDKRYMFDNSYLMLHQPLGGVRGQASDIAILSAQILNVKERLSSMIASKSNLEPNSINDIVDRDCYIDSKKALELKLCDEIFKGVKMANKYSLINQDKKQVQTQKVTKATISLAKNFTHAMIVGETGCGKTSSAILPILKDRINAGYGILAFDYKGVEHAKIKALAKRANRLDDVVMINVPWGKSINLVQNCDSKSMERFLLSSFGGSKGSDFWANSAYNFASQITSILRTISSLSPNIRDVLSLENKDHSLRALFSHTSNHDIFKKLIKEVKNALEIYTGVMFEAKLRNRQISESELISNFFMLNAFINTADKFIQSYGDYLNPSKKDEKERLYNNLNFMLSAISSISNNPMLNSGDTQISGLLRESKIAIINLEGLEDAAVGLIASGVLNSLSRQKDKNPSAVSVFIDEANRVINKKADLCADVLRESRVELVLAFQNQDMIINNLGSKEAYKELVGNLSSQYFFKNSQPQFCEGKDKDFSKLEQFECYFGSKTQKLKPIFIPSDELNKAELEFQKINGVIKNFSIDELDDNEMLIYNKKLLDEFGRLEVLNIKTNNVKEVPCLNKESLNLIKKWLRLDTKDTISNKQSKRKAG